jgi:hypothetical protein
MMLASSTKPKRKGEDQGNYEKNRARNKIKKVRVKKKKTKQEKVKR